MNDASRIFDVLVIGGGINGVGIAADAAGRGLQVALCEAGDLAGATSSASSKLIHGGLRYLEQYDFGLVRKALAEREVLLAKAPHIAWPLRFILPHAPEQRPRWMIRAGLFLYDHLATRRKIPGSSAIRLDQGATRGLFKAPYRHGFAYWDCWVDDARLVVLNARAAADLGANILTRTRVVAARPVDNLWHADCVDTVTGETIGLRSRLIVNAAGPWAGRVLAQLAANRRAPGKPAPELMLVKGSHIVVPRVADLEDALILQNADRRVVFVLPFAERFSLIGTTDVPFDGEPQTAAASEDEIAYLLAAVAQYLARPLARDDVVYSFAGVRPLYDTDTGKSASTASRDFLIHTTPVEGAGPIVSVLGGKITTYRQLAEAALDEIAAHFPDLPGPWTANVPLPGGDIPDGDIETFVDKLASRRPGLDRGLLQAMARRHGSLLDEVLGHTADTTDLGRHYGGGLYEREVHHFIAREWARTAEDILWRRTKIGLHMSDAERLAATEALNRLMLVS